MLSLYHPNKNKLYSEKDDVVVATNELDHLEMEQHAVNAAFSIDVDQAEAILRVEMGSKVSNMSSKEIKRDILVIR